MSVGIEHVASSHFTIINAGGMRVLLVSSLQLRGSLLVQLSQPCVAAASLDAKSLLSPTTAPNKTAHS